MGKKKICEKYIFLKLTENDLYYLTFLCISLLNKIETVKHCAGSASK